MKDRTAFSKLFTVLIASICFLSAVFIQGCSQEKAPADEAKSLVETAELIGPYKLVLALFENRDSEEVKNLVKKLSKVDGVVALVGLKSGRGYLYLGRSPSVEIDASPLVMEACREMDGKGGGSPTLAQGSFREVSRVEAALEKAKNLVLQAVT